MSEYMARDMLARFATEQLKQMLTTYKLGIYTYQPDQKAIDDFNEASLALLDVVANNLLVKVDKNLHYASRKAAGDQEFQQFMKRLDI